MTPLIQMRHGTGYIGCMQQRNNRLAMTLSPEDPLYDPHHAIYDGDATYAADTGFLAVEGRVIDGLLHSGLSLRIGGHAGMSWDPIVSG